MNDIFQAVIVIACCLFCVATTILGTILYNNRANKDIADYIRDAERNCENATAGIGNAQDSAERVAENITNAQGTAERVADTSAELERTTEQYEQIFKEIYKQKLSD